MEKLTEWLSSTGEESRKNAEFFVRSGFYDRFLSGLNILDIGFRGYFDNTKPISPNAVGIDLDYPGYDGSRLPFDDASQDSVFSSHTLEHIADYRSSIKDWFRVLKIGGYLILAVPHQFLYEKKFKLPSDFNADHKRFYTPASLLKEVEEALSPLSYRVRFLEDNDRNFDYTIPPGRHSEGCFEILLVIQKIHSPAWALRELGCLGIEQTEVSFSRQVPIDEISVGINEYRSVVPSPAESLFLLKLDHRGDFLLSLPAIENFRRRFPSAYITLCCGPWNIDAARSSGFVDEVIALRAFPEDPSSRGNSTLDLDAVKNLCEQIHGRAFDIAVDLRVDDDTRILLKYVPASVKAGFRSLSISDLLDIEFPFSNPTLLNRTFRYLISAMDCTTVNGVHGGSMISMRGGLDESGGAGLQVVAKRRAFEAGRYMVILNAEGLSSCQSVRLSVVSNLGAIVKVEREVNLDDVIQFDFELESALTNPTLELFFSPRFNGDLRFFGFEIRKYGGEGGLHQQEAMFMLSDLVYLRSKFSLAKSSRVA